LVKRCGRTHAIYAVYPPSTGNETPITKPAEDGRIVAAGKADAAPYAKQENAKVIDFPAKRLCRR